MPKGTLTLTISKPILAPTPLLTKTEEDNFPTVVDLVSTPFESTEVNGFLVLEKNGSSNVILYDIKNKKNTETLDFYYISPSKNYILTGDCLEKCNYTIRTAEKIIKTDIPIDENWAPAGWLDNERVIFQVRFKRDQVVQPQDVLIYNLFTGEKNSIRLDLPNLYLDRKGWFYPLYFVNASLNPSLNRAAYNDQDGNLVFWDIGTGKKISSLPFTEPIGSFGSIGWSPDGKKFLTTSPDKFQKSQADGNIPLGNELFMFDIDGVITQLTHFNQNYLFANITHPTWSPDNYHIAFWLNTSDGYASPMKIQQRLVIIDIRTNKTTIFRTTSYKSASITWKSSLIWNPDGQYLISRSEVGGYLLIDLTHQTQSFLPLSQDTTVLDWLVP
jgi:Tol biopolymer transport system component